METDARYILIAATTAQERERVQRSTQPTVAALAVLGVAAGTITVTVAGLAVAHALRRSELDQLHWWHLGLRTSERARVAAIPLLVALVGGVTGAIALAWWWSPVGPVGSVRSVEPSPPRGLGGAASLGALALLVALTVVVSLLAWRSARHASRAGVPAANSAVAPSFLRAAGGPAVSEGLRAAWGNGRGAGLVVAGGATAEIALVAALVFGSSLSTLLASPARYGWPWQAANLAGFGYGGVDVERAQDALAAHDDIEQWAGLGFWQGVTVAGVAVPSVVAFDGPSEVELALVEGRLPIAPDEVALGSRFAAEHGLGVGDEVPLARHARVRDADDGECAGAEPRCRAVDLHRPGRAGRRGSRSGARPPARRLPGMGPLRRAARVHRAGPPGGDHQRAVHARRPGGRRRARHRRSIRRPRRGDDRRRELGVLRALGFTGRQVRPLGAAQAIAVVAAAMVVGLPVGLIVGRYAWRNFASQLGVVTTPSVPPLAIVLTVAGGLVVALLAAVVPAQRASRSAPSEVLRRD